MRLEKTSSSLWLYLLWTILSFITVYFFEVAISPRYGLFYGDCSVFKTVAQSWIEGDVPYKDIFDHKGPYLYLINVIGLLISEKWGLFLLSAINLSIVTSILWFTGKLYVKGWQSAICVCLFWACYICVNNGGNMTESWSLPFCVIPLYLFCADSLKGYGKLWHNIAYGFCFGIVAFIRINNGIIPATIVLVLFIKAIRERKFKLALNQVGLQIIGLLISVCPMLIYFYLNGALYDLIYANYIFNIEYMSRWTTIVGDNYSDMINRVCANFRWIFPLIILFTWSIRNSIKKQLDKEISMMLAISSGITILTNWRGMNYLHYYITFLPLIFMLFVKVSAMWNIEKYTRRPTKTIIMIAMTILWAVTILLPCLFGWTMQLGKDVYKFGILHSDGSNETIEEIEEMIVRNIPNGCTNDIYNMGTYDGVAGLLQLHIRPSGKYFFLQPKLYKVSTTVANEIDDYHLKAEPVYILTDKANLESDCKSFIVMLDNYQLVDSTSNSQYLYKISDYIHE